MYDQTNEMKLTKTQAKELYRMHEGKDIYDDLEREILYRRLDNNRDAICKYILENYQ